MADDLTAALNEIRNRGYMNRGYGTEGEMLFLVGAARDDVPRLLAVADAVLKLAGDWDTKARAQEKAAAEVAAEDPFASRIGLMHARGGAYAECAGSLDQAISRALLSTKGESDD